MARKHIKVNFIQGTSEGWTVDDLLDQAVRSESLDHREWADYYLREALMEERKLQVLGERGVLEIGV